MPKSGGACFSIFWRADDVTRTMSKGGGVLVNVFTPLQEILYPRLCSTYPSSDPPPGWLATGLIMCMYMACIYCTICCDFIPIPIAPGRPCHLSKRVGHRVRVVGTILVSLAFALWWEKVKSQKSGSTTTLG